MTLITATIDGYERDRSEMKHLLATTLLNSASIKSFLIKCLRLPKYGRSYDNKFFHGRYVSRKARIIEKLSGIPFAEFAIKNIVKSLKMTNSVLAIKEFANNANLFDSLGKAYLTNK
ncbi:hypothetical protein OQ267_18630 [Pedobacter sp. MR22-3]|nr:hypothetical protein [Pedobacter sp. MR22-3]